jgi:ParB family chromosome partitioning protein
MEKVVIRTFVPDLALDKIEVAEENVRKTRQKAGLEELKLSIGKLGLIHPVVVVPSRNKYKLIVGQRRYLAFKALGKSTIPALVIDPMDSTAETIVSLGENIHRKELPYDDTIAVCDALFNEYTGSKFERVKKIATDLGISPATVSKYLAYRLIPKPVRILVDQGKLSAKVAYRITTALWPNEALIIDIAKSATRMTKSEWERALDVGKKNPKASAKEIVEQAKKPAPVYEIVIPMDPETGRQLEEIAKERKTEVKDLILNLINSLLEEEEGS